MKLHRALFIASAICMLKVVVSDEAGVNLWLSIAGVVMFALACILFNWKLDEEDTSARDSLLIVVGWKLLVGGGLIGLIAIIVGIVLAVTQP